MCTLEKVLRYTAEEAVYIYFLREICNSVKLLPIKGLKLYTMVHGVYTSYLEKLTAYACT